MRENHTPAQVHAAVSEGLGVPADAIIHRGFDSLVEGAEKRCVALSKLSKADEEIRPLLSNPYAAATGAQLVFGIYPGKNDTNEECLSKARAMAPLYPNVKIAAYVQSRADRPPMLCV